MAQQDDDDQQRRGSKWHARRDEIVDTSARLFAQRGFHATGIADLCTANELGKGGLYHYIGSKEQLLAAIHERVMDEVLRSADRVAHAVGTPSEHLVMLGAELLDIIARYPDHVWVFLHEYPALTAEDAEHSGHRRQEYDRRIEAILRAGIDAGEFRTDLDVRLTALGWLGMHNYAYRWLKSRERFSAEEVATAFADLFLRGIAAEPGGG
jgi:AcrR family transcriptional regulator